MENTLKENIRKLGFFMLIAAVIPFFMLLAVLLPEGLRQIVAITVVSYPLFCFFVLLWGNSIIWSLPLKSLYRIGICIAWFPFYTLLCWSWATLVIGLMMQIFGHV